MVDQLGGGVGAVLVDDGEGGGVGHVLLYAQAAREGVDEGCLAGAHFAVEGKDGVVVHEAYKAVGGLFETLESVNFNNFLTHVSV